MKRALFLLLLALLLFLPLPSCGEEPPDPVAEIPYIFVEDRVEMAISGDAGEILTALGRPDMEVSEPNRTTRTYPGFVLTTSGEEGEERIESIQLTDATVATWEGLYIGCTEAQVRAVYGDAEEDAKEEEKSGSESAPSSFDLTYPKGDMKLVFSFEDGLVSSILYLPR